MLQGRIPHQPEDQLIFEIRLQHLQLKLHKCHLLAQMKIPFHLNDFAESLCHLHELMHQECMKDFDPRVAIVLLQVRGIYLELIFQLRLIHDFAETPAMPLQLLL